MRMQSCVNGIKVLKEARDACSSQLDDGALAKLDDAISVLEEDLERSQTADEAEMLKLRILQAIAAFVSITTNLGDWMK